VGFLLFTTKLFRKKKSTQSSIISFYCASKNYRSELTARAE